MAYMNYEESNLGDVMSILFEPISINGMDLKNRFIRSATYDGSTDMNGYVTDRQLALFKDLAQGDIGLIVTGITHVHPTGQISPVQNAIDRDDCIAGLRKLTDMVHEYDSKIAVQLFHAGRERALIIQALEIENEQALSSSDFIPDDPYFSEPYRAMTEDEIQEVISAFGKAAVRAREAGFDAVQVHAAHAYLLSQFFSPYTNRRDDDWGGGLDQKASIASGNIRRHSRRCG